MSAAPAYLMRTSARQPVSFSRGQGASLWGTEGVEYLDAIAGVAVTSLGHANPEIAAAIAEQTTVLLHTTNLFAADLQ
jgi:acetylornithine/N-succinyldiaminopimelate aminotransferase